MRTEAEEESVAATRSPLEATGVGVWTTGQSAACKFFWVTVEAGAAGFSWEVLLDWATQHFILPPQLQQGAGKPAQVAALVASGWPKASARMNNMANACFTISAYHGFGVEPNRIGILRLLLGGFFGGVEFLQILGGVFFEVLEAALAAEAHLAAFVGVDEGLAHLTEFFAGDDAGFERVGFGGIRRLGVLGEGGEGDADTGKQGDRDE